MEEKGSCEMEFSGVESDAVVVTTNPTQRQWVENSNAAALRQWMYHSYLPQNYAIGASSNAYQALPTKRDGERRFTASTSTPWKVRPSSQVFNNSTWSGAGPIEAPNSAIYGHNVWYGMPQLEEEMQQKLGSESSQCRVQESISMTDGSSSKNGGLHPANVATTDSASTQLNKGKKHGLTLPYENDRRRRKIISERLRALQAIVPQSEQGHPGDLLEDIIDYVKYLQLQLKDLSQSRLEGEPVSNPLVFIEGYGYYFAYESMLNEPLDEMMGTLLEVNPQDAAAILESKGLCIRDMSLAKGLQDTL